jgi:phosphoglycerate dehydrogenase-like enzyme
MAAIDVYEEEPLGDPDHPLLKMENVVNPKVFDVLKDQQERK